MAERGRGGKRRRNSNAIAAADATKYMPARRVSVAQRSHAQAAKRAAQEEKHAALKNVLHNMSTNWVARIERHPAVYLTQCAMVVFSVLFYCLETLQELEDVIPDLVWFYAELIFTLFFTLEVVLRYRATRATQEAFWTDTYVWFDIIAIIPFYVVVMICISGGNNPFTGECNTRESMIINALQALKILRIFKMSRHFTGTKILWRAFKESANALTVPATFLMIFGTTFAAVLFWIEKGSINEEAGVDLIEGGDSPGFTSVVNAAYFVVVTIVTVGYGDITPKTGVGKLLTVFIIMFGVFFTAMPLAIVGNEFYNAVEKEPEYELDAEEDMDGVIPFDDLPHRYVQLGAAVSELRYDATDSTYGSSASDPVPHSKLELLRAKLRRFIRNYVRFAVLVKRAAQPPAPCLEPIYIPRDSEFARANMNGTRGYDRPRTSCCKRCLSFFHLMLEDPRSSRAARILHWIIVILIAASIMGFVAETMSEIRYGVWPVNPLIFFYLDAFVNTFFTIEFVIRFFVAPNKKLFIREVFNWFDFIAILPFYLELLDPGNESVQWLRLARMLRIFKVSKNFAGTKVLLTAFKTSVKPLLIPLYFLLVFVLIFSTGFYLLERGVAIEGADGGTTRVFPDGTQSDVTDVFIAGWVILVTMTSVGYGDITPTTMFGKLLCSVAMLFGLLYLAMPIAIVGTNFYKAYEKQRDAASNRTRREVGRITITATHLDTVIRMERAAARLARAVAALDLYMMPRSSPFFDGASSRDSHGHDGSGSGAGSGSGSGAGAGLGSGFGSVLRRRSERSSVEARFAPDAAGGPARGAKRRARLAANGTFAANGEAVQHTKTNLDAAVANSDGGRADGDGDDTSDAASALAAAGVALGARPSASRRTLPPLSANGTGSGAGGSNSNGGGGSNIGDTADKPPLPGRGRPFDDATSHEGNEQASAGETPRPKECPITVGELYEATNAFASEFITAGSLLNFIRAAVLSERENILAARDGHLGEVVTALPSGGRHNWVHFRAALQSQVAIAPDD